MTKNIRVSIQGYRGSFHHIAAEKFLGKDLRLLERDTFGEIFKDVSGGKADYGVVAIENSTAGSLYENYDLFKKNDLQIVGEVYLHIAQQLIVLPGTLMKDIRDVRSHVMAIKQCRSFLDGHPKWNIIDDKDTAESVEKIKKNRLGNCAAIASVLAAEIHGMKVIRKDIQDQSENYTRFFLVTKENKAALAGNKSSIIVCLAHRPGTLLGLLNVFASRGINLAKIESRPIVGKVWQYNFFLDFEADIREAGLLVDIRKNCKWVKILGCYGKGRYEGEAGGALN